MSFKSQLIDYMDQIGCSSKDLSLVSGLSTSSISRYRSGDRKPPVTSKHIRQIAEGLCKLAKEHNISDFESPHRVTQSLIRSINKSPFIFDFTSFRSNFADLVNAFHIELKDLSGYVDLDEAYLSGILSSKRQPAEPGLLVEGICRYMIDRHSAAEDKEISAYLLACEPKDIASEQDYYDALHYWLNTTQNDHRKSAAKLLHAIDDYDPSCFDRILAESSSEPMQSVWQEYPGREIIYDRSKFESVELAFIDSLSDLDSGSSVFIYNDLSFRALEQNGTEFSHKWRIALAKALAKGIKIDIILNVDIPFKRVLYNLEQWLPFFMTGNLSPYYLKGVQSSIFNHILLVSDEMAVTAESVVEDPDHARYSLITDAEEVSYLRRKATAMMERALPLIDIYTLKNFRVITKSLSQHSLTQGEKRSMVTSIPLFLADDSFIEEVCRKNGLSETESDRMLQAATTERMYADIASKNGDLSFIVNSIFASDLGKNDSISVLSYTYPAINLRYSYHDYQRHIEQAEAYISTKKHMHISFVKSQYSSIQILIHRGKFVFVEHLSEPHCGFVIKHPKLCKAIEGLVFPDEAD